MSLPQELSRGLTVREFAEINGISYSTVRRNVRNGRIPSYKVAGSRRIRADVAAELQQPQHVQERDSFNDDDLAAEIKRIVDLAPKFTAAQRDQIAAIFAELGGGGVNVTT